MNEKTIQAIVDFARIQIQITKAVNKGKRLSDNIFKRERKAVEKLVKTYGITERNSIHEIADKIIYELE